MSKHKIITKQEALSKGLTRYFSGQPCRKGHVAERWTAGGACGECEREWNKTPAGRASKRASSRKYAQSPAGRASSRKYEKTPAGRASQRKYVQSPAGRASNLASSRKYAQSLKGRASSRKYEKTPERREYSRKYAQSLEGREAQRRWDQSEKGRLANRDADLRRNAIKRGATVVEKCPLIRAFTAETIRLKRETGIPYEDDHDFPLQPDPTDFNGYWIVDGEFVKAGHRLSGPLYHDAVRVKKGKHHISNLRRLTHSENSAKGNKIPARFNAVMGRAKAAYLRKHGLTVPSH